MAPFPETEDMTIKRLKVALRKNDYQLLKMGTYKLHEKFHTGYEFELTDDLRQILEHVEQNSLPPEISDILCSTIKDILSKKAMKEISKENEILPSDSGKNEMPKNLQINDIRELAQKINSEHAINAPLGSKIEPVGVKMPEIKPVTFQNINEKTQQNSYYTPQETFKQPVMEEKVEYNTVKNIAVFYDDYKNNVDYSKIKNYKNNLNLLFSQSENGQDYNVLKQISSLTHALDTNTDDIDKIISMLTTSKGKVSFVTASQSQNFTKLFLEKQLDFDIPFVKKAENKDNAFNLIPMTGATNIFVCSNCNLRTLKTDFNTRTLSVQCPHCDSAAFPDIYAINSYNPDCNPVFWHRAFAAFVKSQIWILINPPLDENKEIIFDFIKTAYEAKPPEKIYILSKENDKKEFYRQAFMAINDKCTIKMNFLTQDKLCEEFINEEIIKKVFA